ncbi:DUF3891 family protein [Scytonema sp. UIC 10036]|uniref:DUF3891 family protein n=1 Tax=Scytonema sp. UIC 10036 TaxID=2304196 RepID=UPI001FAA5CF2|nr:DUF3891 family protein [Scytonema sp. UIC 10036]
MVLKHIPSVWQNYHLNHKYEFQEKLIETLSHDEYYARYATREAIERNQKLVATWDTLSILLCQGFTGKQEVTQVPTLDGTIALQLTLVENKNNRYQITVSPWPFGESEVNTCRKIFDPNFRNAVTQFCSYSQQKQILLINFKAYI